MAVEDFPANSQGPKKSSTRPEKKIERVTQSSVSRRRKPLGRRFAETFVQGNPEGVGGYVVFDVLLPALKDMVVDATMTGLERSLYGERVSSSRRGSGRQGYGSRYRGGSGRDSSPPWKQEEKRERRMSRRGRAMHDFEEIILDSRAEADEVMDRMFHILETYEQVTVGDLYDLTGEDHTASDDRFGWDDLRGAGITRLGRGGGYLLDLPRPIEFD